MISASIFNSIDGKSTHTITISSELFSLYNVTDDNLSS